MEGLGQEPALGCLWHLVNSDVTANVTFSLPLTPPWQQGFYWRAPPAVHAEERGGWCELRTGFLAAGFLEALCLALARAPLIGQDSISGGGWLVLVL